MKLKRVATGRGDEVLGYDRITVLSVEATINPGPNNPGIGVVCTCLVENGRHFRQTREDPRDINTDIRNGWWVLDDAKGGHHA